MELLAEMGLADIPAPAGGGRRKPPQRLPHLPGAPLTQQPTSGLDPALRTEG